MVIYYINDQKLIYNLKLLNTREEEGKDKIILPPQNTWKIFSTVKEKSIDASLDGGDPDVGISRQRLN